MSEETAKPKKKVSAKGKKRKQSPVLYAAVITVLAVLLVVGIIVGIHPGKEEEPEESLPPVVEEKYDAKENEITSEEFSGTILPKTKDAGQEYIDSTLFIGDSNTARFLRTLNKDGKTFTSRTNTIGVVGMGIDAISSLACLDTSMGRLTMPMAVKALQPERVIITFGTNNLSGTSTDATSFIERYTKQIKAIQNAYPSVDIIINSIPPVSRRRDYINVSMTQIDAYNKAIAAMCEKNEWKYLNSAEALKNKDDGYAKDGYLVADGLHFSQEGMQALFEYIRTHAYITEDDRPKPLAAVPYVTGVPDGLIRINPLNEEEFKGSEGGEEPAPQQTPDENTEEGCKTVGKYWYDTQCNDEPTSTPTPTATSTTETLPDNENDCRVYFNNEEGHWYDGKCHKEKRTSTPDSTASPEPTGTPEVTPTPTPTPDVTPTPTPTPAPTSTPEPVPTSVTCWDGSSAANYEGCPAQFTCWNGAVVHNEAECPPQQVTCWDGSSAANYESCPAQFTCWNGAVVHNEAECPPQSAEPTTESVQPTESTNSVTE
ncbi:MAG: SGNH/GDSL hydrolase family protein [Solobacterium sp.]|nr:SGNH/GDSL hydrolase family protein [Solobacterium sp.]